MSGYQAYLSFANFLKTALNGSGIAVEIEKHETSTPPYLVLQDGPESAPGKWLSSRMCQGWLVVAKLSTEPLEVTMGKAMDKVIKATQDTGFIEKYDHEQTPKKLVGSVVIGIQEITADLSNDPRVARKVITWNLSSNAAAGNS